MLPSALAANGTLLCASRPPPAGVECHRGHVRSLTIRSAGTLPTELGRLPALQSLRIAAPSLEGTLPTQLGTLATLQQLTAVRSDHLSGTLPPRLGGVCSESPRAGAPPMAAHNSWASACHFSTELRLSLPRLSGTLTERLPGVGVGLLDVRGCTRLSGSVPSWLSSVHHARLGPPQPWP